LSEAEEQQTGIASKLREEKSWMMGRLLTICWVILKLDITFWSQASYLLLTVLGQS